MKKDRVPPSPDRDGAAPVDSTGAVEPKWLTAAEVAAQLRISKPTVYRLVDAGKMPGKRFGRVVRIPADALARYLAPARNAGGKGGGQ